METELELLIYYTVDNLEPKHLKNIKMKRSINPFFISSFDLEQWENALTTVCLPGKQDCNKIISRLIVPFKQHGRCKDCILLPCTQSKYLNLNRQPSHWNQPWKKYYYAMLAKGSLSRHKRFMCLVLIANHNHEEQNYSYIFLSVILSTCPN